MQPCPSPRSTSNSRPTDSPWSSSARSNRQFRSIHHKFPSSHAPGPLATEGNVSGVSPTALPLEQSLPLAGHDHVLSEQYISYETVYKPWDQGWAEEPVAGPSVDWGAWTGPDSFDPLLVGEGQVGDLFSISGEEALGNVLRESSLQSTSNDFPKDHLPITLDKWCFSTSK